MQKRTLGLLFLLISLTALVAAQTAAPTGVSSLATAKFAPMDGLPSCMALSVLHGDPGKGPAAILLKSDSGCVVPWHWHTANEQLILAHGTAIVEMKGAKPMPMKPGDYVYLPAKGIHRFTATSQVLLYDVIDGAFDIHYVDAAGKEIPADKALAATTQAKPAPSPAPKQ